MAERTGQYAKDTRVTTERSRNEIEKLLKRFGASKFMYGWQEESQMLAFEYDRRQIRIILPMPKYDQIAHTETGKKRSQASMENAYDQAVREKWRAMVLLVKAKLAGVEAGIVTFEEEFLAPTVTPSGATVGQWLLPQLQIAIDAGHMPPLLPGPTHE